MLSVLTLSILLMFLTSCSSIKPLEVLNLEVKREPLNLDQPEVADFENLQWYIINSENAEEVFAKLKKENVDPVLFGLTDEGYEQARKAGKALSKIKLSVARLYKNAPLITGS